MENIKRCSSTLLIFFFFGALATIGQIIVIREFLVLFSGSQLCLGLLFFSWFVWIALGAGFYRRVSRKIPDPFMLLCLLSLVSIILLCCEVAVIRNLRGFTGVDSFFLFPVASMFLSAFFILAPFCLVVGFLFPLGVFLCESCSGNPPGIVYKWESLGSMTGGILFTLVFVDRLSHFNTIMLLGCCMALFMLLNNGFSKSNSAMRWPFTLILIIFCALIPFSNRIDAMLVQARWNGFAKGIVLLESRDSRYENISIGKYQDQYSVYLNGQITFSFPDPYTDAKYIHPIMLQHVNPSKILLIGTPTQELLSEMLLYAPQTIDCVENDPLIMKSIMKYWKDSTKIPSTVKILEKDGRQYIRTCKEKYDLVIINLAEPSTGLTNRFYTKEFYNEVKRILNSDGVLVTGLASAVNYLSNNLGGYNASVYRSLCSVFGNCKAAPGERMLLVASEGDYISLNSNTLKERYNKKDILSKNFDPDYFVTLFETDKVAWLKNELENHHNEEGNSDLKPITYFLHSVVWSVFTEGYMPAWFLNVFGLWQLTFFILVLALIFVLMKPSTRSRLSITISINGFTGMFLEIMLLFLFQNLRGHLYGEIGLFVGLFMFGLFLGSFVAERFRLDYKEDNASIEHDKHAQHYEPDNLDKHDEKRAQGNRIMQYFKHGMHSLIIPQTILIVVLCILFILVSFPILNDLNTFGLYVVFILFFVLSGAIVGYLFPVTTLLYAKSNANAHYPNQYVLSNSSAKLNAYDTIGASLGALLGGTLLIPILGIQLSCVILLIMNTATLLVMMSTKQKVR